MASFLPIPMCSNFALSLWGINSPLVLVLLISVVIGLAMVVVFRYTSDQKAIHVAKDQLKAHLLAVRLYQDQLQVVLRAYTRIITGTGRYIRLAFKPLLLVIIPITLFMVQVDRYLGALPVKPEQSFLLKVKTSKPDTLNEVSLQLPSEVIISAPAVHIPADNEIVWRLVAQKNGTYDLNVAAAGQTYSKQVVVSPDVSRLSPERLRAPFWERMFVSGEPALPDGSPIRSIAVTYLPRNVEFAWIEWNWIVLFFVLSLVAGFIFKEALGIEI